MRIYTIRKWHKNSKGTGAFVEISCYDEEAQKWLNVKLHVPFASNYAGKEEDELPAALASAKDGVLTIKCRVFDDYVPNAREADEKEVKNAKKGKTQSKKSQKRDDDDDIPF